MFSAVSFKQASFSPTSFKYDTLPPSPGGAPGMRVFGHLTMLGMMRRFGVRIDH